MDVGGVPVAARTSFDSIEFVIAERDASAIRNGRRVMGRSNAAAVAPALAAQLVIALDTGTNSRLEC